MELLNGWILAAFGAGAALIPLLLHLLSRRRAHLVDWGAMQFLQFSTSAKRRKLLIEEILLMIVRCGLLALLGLALCRPFLKNPVFDAAIAGKHRDLAIVVDGSFSMKASEGMTDRLALARNAALRTLEVLRPGDSVSVLLAGDQATTVCPPCYHPFTQAKEAIQRLDATNDGMDVPAALLAAAATLEDTRNPVKEVVFITDGQAAGWKLDKAAYWRQVARDFAPGPRPYRLDVLNVAPADAATDNMAIVEATPSRSIIGTDRPVGVRVVFENFGRRPMVNHDVTVKVDDEVISTEILEPIEPGKTLTRVFWHRFKDAGGHRMTVAVDHPDALGVDDSATVAVNVRQSLPVLLVNGQPGTAADPFSSGTVFLETALSPEAEAEGEGEQGTEQLGRFVEPTEVAPANLDEGLLSKYPVVVLVDLPQLDARTGGLLLDYVTKGGGLLIVPGDRLQRAVYNSQAVALMPALLEEPVGDADAKDDVAQVVSASLAEDGPLGLFRDRANTDIESPQFYRRFPLKTADGVRVHGWLSDRTPFLVEKRIGEGSVMLLSVPLDRSWSNLPRKNCFVPLVHRLISYLAAPLAGEANTTASRIVLPLEAAEKITRIQMTTPTGRSEALAIRTVGGRPAAVYEKAYDRGLYRFEIQRGDALQVAYVSRPLDAAESDLAPLPEAAQEGVKRQISADFFTSFAPLGARLVAGSEGSEIWRWLVFGLIAMLVVEIFLTRRVSRRQHMAGSGGVRFGAAEGV